MPQSQPGQHGGWTFEGNTLTTIVPVPEGSVAAKVTVEVRRASGLDGAPRRARRICRRDDAPARSL